MTGICVSSCPSAVIVTWRVIGSPAGRLSGSRDQSSVSVSDLAGSQAAFGKSGGAGGIGSTLTVIGSDSKIFLPVIRPPRKTRASNRAGEIVKSPLSCGNRA